MRSEDYTIEYCPFCEQDVAIRSHGITTCPFCGKPLAPCSVCVIEWKGCKFPSPCPYGCTGGAEDEFLPVTNPPMTEEEIAFAWENC